ncbi:hypothetical protein F4677DRAFT_446628 [Hypoxylon crocopeplum]|nr:hypothetical protein F4677DRAFT_446628 [Hypoxylon crocopeplum]
MKFSLASAILWATVALSQQIPACSRELAETDDCADVINANACYNQFRFRDNQTLSCIGGTDNNDRAKKARHAPDQGLLRANLLTSCRPVGNSTCYKYNRSATRIHDRLLAQESGLTVPIERSECGSRSASVACIRLWK